MVNSKQIQFNGVNVECHPDGSVTKPFYNKTKRTFGSNAKGYKITLVGNKLVPVHRMIAKAYCDGYDEKLDCDHIDGDKSNNVPENLRWLTRSQNLRAFSSARGGSSKHQNISWQKDIGFWRVQCQVGKKRHHVGIYRSEEDAVKARDEFIAKHSDF